MASSSKRRQKSTGGGGVGQGRRPQAVEKHRVVAPGLDVVEAGAPAQGVVGDVEHVVGLVIGAVLGQHMHRGVDLGGQANLGHQAGDHAHAAVGRPLGALRQLVADVRPPQHRAGGVGRHRRRQSPLDATLLACQVAPQLPLGLAHPASPIAIPNHSVPRLWLGGCHTDTERTGGQRA